jgi:hypothetical protein
MGNVEHEVWRREADGHLSAEVPGLKLIVRKLDNCARYVIVRRADDDGSCAEAMLSSGTDPSVDAAIAAARRAAARTEVMLAARRRLDIQMVHRSRTVLSDDHVEG